MVARDNQAERITDECVFADREGGTIGGTKYLLYNSPFLSLPIERSTNGWPPPSYAWEREIDSGVFVRCLPWKWKVRFSPKAKDVLNNCKRVGAFSGKESFCYKTDARVFLRT